MTRDHLDHYLSKIHLPLRDSHKGQNGKVMIIGGSELFHAASQWSLLVASRLVDMVFYSSIPSNNELIQEAKAHFPNGIVVARDEVENYIEEAQVVLIGPGMVRERKVNKSWQEKLLSGCKWETFLDKNNSEVRIRKRKINQPLSQELLNELANQIDWQSDTYAVTNFLLAKYPYKKWVIDAGALQMCEPALLNSKMIVTPHERELETVFKNLENWVNESDQGEDVQVGTTTFVGEYYQYFDGLSAIEEKPKSSADSEFFDHMREDVLEMSRQLGNAIILLKGHADKIVEQKKLELITGGNVGMTKGGTGDVLAGLVAGLYAFTDNPFAAAVVGSYVNKTAGDELYQSVGPFFNAKDLANQIPQTLKAIFKL